MIMFSMKEIDLRGKYEKIKSQFKVWFLNVPTTIVFSVDMDSQTGSLKSEADQSNSRRVKDNIMQKKYCKIGIIITILTCAFCFPTAETAVSDETPDFKVIIGEWIRPDGGYVVHVRDVKPDGSVEAGYYNPNEINISESNVSLWKVLVKLFIKL